MRGEEREMAEEKESTSIPLSQAVDPENPAKAPPATPSSSTRKVRAPRIIIVFVLYAYQWDCVLESLYRKFRFFLFLLPLNFEMEDQGSRFIRNVDKFRSGGCLVG